MDSGQYEFNGVYWKHKRVFIPKDTKIGPGSVIGALPLKTAFDDAGVRYRLPIPKSVSIGENVDIGSGVIINLGVQNNTIISSNVFIGHNTVIGHDCWIFSGAVVAVGCNICGEVIIKSNAYVSAGTTIQPKCKIGVNTMIGNNSTVTEDIPDGAIAWGSPCKPIRKNEFNPPTPLR